MKPVRMTGLVAKDLTMQLTIDADANDNSVIAVDLVAIDDKKTLAAIQDMTAAQWFAKREDVVRMKARDLKIASWEFVPGSILPDQHVTAGVGKLGVVLFANYSSKGEHRAVLPQVGRVQVQYGATDFTVTGPAQPSADDPAKTAPFKAPKIPKAPKLP